MAENTTKEKISREALLEAIGSLSSAEKRALLGGQPVQASGDFKISSYLSSLDAKEKARVYKVLVEASKQDNEKDMTAVIQKDAPDCLNACVTNSARRLKSVGHSVNVCILWLARNLAQ